MNSVHLHCLFVAWVALSCIDTVVVFQNYCCDTVAFSYVKIEKVKGTHDWKWRSLFMSSCRSSNDRFESVESFLAPPNNSSHNPRHL